MKTARRDFLLGAAAASAAFGFAAKPMLARSEIPAPELTTDPAHLIDLPKGFTYTVISRAGGLMADGLILPDRPDGMTSFALDRHRHLVLRNHENGVEQDGRGAFRGTPPDFLKARAYDLDDDGLPHPGGVSGFVWNSSTQKMEQDWLALAGTLINCSGGPTPWGSWISSEETVVRKGENAQADHGYNFEIPFFNRGLVEPVPLKAMGRFRHEGVAVDPATGIVYQTEDRKDGLFYRFIPDQPGTLRVGGRLQALAIRDEPGRDTRNWPGLIPGMSADQLPARKAKAVEWIDLVDVNNPDDDLRTRGAASGAAIFARGEGVWFGKGEVYFTCTIGGANESGQIWRYRPSRFEGRPDEAKMPGQLTLWSEPGDATLVDRCDNITIHPSGALVICEDGEQENYVRMMTRAGQWRRVARNAHPEGGEMTGACFTPDGKTMFVNLQDAGITLAVTGPWESLA